MKKAIKRFSFLLLIDAAIAIIFRNELPTKAITDMAVYFGSIILIGMFLLYMGDIKERKAW